MKIRFLVTWLKCLVVWHFCRISVIFVFSILNELKCIRISFMIFILAFWVSNGKNGLNLINLKRSEDKKTNTWYMISSAVESFWIWCHLNSISTALKLYSHIAVFQCFCRIPFIPEFSFFGVELKRKTRKLRKVLIFIVFQAISNGFFYF